MRTFPDLRQSAFVSQLRKHRSARRSEERICITPPLYEPLIEPPVLMVSRVSRPTGHMFALKEVNYVYIKQYGDERMYRDSGAPDDLLLAASLAFNLASHERCSRVLSRRGPINFGNTPPSGRVSEQPPSVPPSHRFSYAQKKFLTQNCSYRSTCTWMNCDRVWFSLFGCWV